MEKLEKEGFGIEPADRHRRIEIRTKCSGAPRSRAGKTETSQLH